MTNNEPDMYTIWRTDFDHGTTHQGVINGGEAVAKEYCRQNNIVYFGDDNPKDDGYSYERVEYLTPIVNFAEYLAERATMELEDCWEDEENDD
jgi:hypothetical protein